MAFNSGVAKLSSVQSSGQAFGGPITSKSGVPARWAVASVTKAGVLPGLAVSLRWTVQCGAEVSEVEKRQISKTFGALHSDFNPIVKPRFPILALFTYRRASPQTLKHRLLSIYHLVSDPSFNTSCNSSKVRSQPHRPPRWLQPRRSRHATSTTALLHHVLAHPVAIALLPGEMVAIATVPVGTTIALAPAATITPMTMTVQPGENLHLPHL